MYMYAQQRTKILNLFTQKTHFFLADTMLFNLHLHLHLKNIQKNKKNT